MKRSLALGSQPYSSVSIAILVEWDAQSYGRQWYSAVHSMKTKTVAAGLGQTL